MVSVIHSTIGASGIVYGLLTVWWSLKYTIFHHFFRAIKETDSAKIGCVVTIISIFILVHGISLMIIERNEDEDKNE